MASFLRENWQNLSIALLAGGLVTLSLCRGSSGCFLVPGRTQPSAPTEAAVPANPQPLVPEGEEKMSTGYAQGKVLHANEETFQQHVLEADVPVLVDFYADWCSPCKYLAPTVELLADEFGGDVKFYKVDVDQHPDIAAGYGVKLLPTVMIFADGELVAAWVGAQPAEEYRNTIKDILHNR